MQTGELSELLKVYYERKRKEIKAVVGKEGFGWTPCRHYRVCIGWCPECLDLKAAVERIPKNL